MKQEPEVVYLRTAQVRARYGNVSHMWIERRLKNDLTFPRPIYWGRQRFWCIDELEAWEQSLPRTKGLFAGLTDEQKEQALAYRGPENHGNEG